MMGRTGGKEPRNGERKRRREKGLVAKEKEGRRYREKYRRRKKRAADRPSGGDAPYGETRGAERAREIDKKVKWHGERQGMGEEEAKKLRKKGKGRERRSSVAWDEEFSLASPRCLYTRGLACTAMGHISVSRERLEARRQKIRSSVKIA